jgi:hypothetical protein
MGEYFLNKTRLEFYKVISGLVKHLKETTEKSDASFMISCLYWQIRASDHEYLMRTGVIEAINKGDEYNSNNIIK